MNQPLTPEILFAIVLTAFVSAFFAEAAKELWKWVKAKLSRKTPS